MDYKYLQENVHLLCTGLPVMYLQCIGIVPPSGRISHNLEMAFTDYVCELIQIDDIFGDKEILRNMRLYNQEIIV